MSNFRVGQKVVCIDPVDDAEDPNPVFGSVYTVSFVYVDEGDEIMIDLIELPNPETDTFQRGYCSKSFRPVIERKTDISIFKAMLEDKKARVRA